MITEPVSRPFDGKGEQRPWPLILEGPNAGAEHLDSSILAISVACRASHGMRNRVLSKGPAGRALLVAHGSGRM